jgi:TldD protein
MRVSDHLRTGHIEVVMSSRREFLKSCTLGAAVLGVSTPGSITGSASAQQPGPDPVFRPLTDTALETARSSGATYCDIRVARYGDQHVLLRTQAEFGTSTIRHTPTVSDSERFGFGVRVLRNGTWGFAASNKVDRDEVARITREAIKVAETNSALRHSPVELAPIKPAVDLYRTPFSKDPLAVSIAEKLDFMRTLNTEVMKTAKLLMAVSYFDLSSEHKWFASTDGSYIEQYIQRIEPGYSCTAVDGERRLSRDRNFQIGAITRGMGIRRGGEND